MIISTSALATSTIAIITLVGVLGTKIFLVLAVTLGLGIGLWFLYKTVNKAKQAISPLDLSDREYNQLSANAKKRHHKAIRKWNKKYNSHIPF